MMAIDIELIACDPPWQNESLLDERHYALWSKTALSQRFFRKRLSITIQGCRKHPMMITGVNVKFDDKTCLFWCLVTTGRLMLAEKPEVQAGNHGVSEGSGGSDEPPFSRTPLQKIRPPPTSNVMAASLTPYYNYIVHLQWIYSYSANVADSCGLV